MALLLHPYINPESRELHSGLQASQQAMVRSCYVSYVSRWVAVSIHQGPQLCSHCVFVF